MRSSLMMSAALFGLVAGAAPAFAQNSVGSAQNPPAMGAGSQSPQPANSMPAGSVAAPVVTPGANLGTTGAGVPPPGARVQAARPVRPIQGTPGRRGKPSTPELSRDDTGDASAPPTSAYRGGAGSPYSAQASNITNANSRNVVAPRLPDPAAGANTPEALLTSAQRSLQQGKTGAAQEALERAETRILSRTIDPSRADEPSQAAMARHISEARRALGSRNTAMAQAEISAALASPVPPRGPTTTMSYPGGPVMTGPGYPPPGYVAPTGPGLGPTAYPQAPIPPAPGYTAPRTY